MTAEDPRAPKLPKQANPANPRKPRANAASKAGNTSPNIPRAPDASSVSNSDAEYKYRSKVVVVDALLSGWKTLLAVGGVVAIAYFTFRTVDVLAGRSTNSNIMLKLVTDLKIGQWLPATFGVIMGTYGYNERRLKKKTVKRLHGRVKELEEKIDPTRTSSGLTQTGETRPEDDK